MKVKIPLNNMKLENMLDCLWQLDQPFCIYRNDYINYWQDVLRGKTIAQRIIHFEQHANSNW